jgi:hypothetical protein
VSSSSVRDSAFSLETPQGVQLGELLGVGSFGRVYNGKGVEAGCRSKGAWAHRSGGLA